jgi:hypothetical protein
MVEHVPSAVRWWALGASGYCVAAGLALAASDPGFGWGLGAFFALAAAIPQLCRGRAGFLVAGRTAIAVIAVGGVVTTFFGGCLFLPAAVPLLFAVRHPVWSARSGPEPAAAPVRTVRGS